MNERRQYLSDVEARVRASYDAFAPDCARWLVRNRYYYGRKVRVLRHILPQPGRVLEIGCGLGQNLAGLNPVRGLGIDSSPAMIEEARKRYPPGKFPNIEFRCMPAFEAASIAQTFDAILLVNTIAEIPELLDLFAALRPLCTPRTRIVQISHNYLMLPLVQLGAALGLCPPRPQQNWLTKFDFQNMAKLAGFETVDEGFDLLLPCRVPWLSDFINRYLPLVPGMKHLCLLYYTVMRPTLPRGAPKDFTVSVCVPCKNEEDNIAEVVARIPDMGRATEILMVDDQSTDATADRIREQIAAHPDRDIRFVQGPGQGKGAACRAGFAQAKNDVLMILDADMTVMPEDLPPFLEALASGKGEFVNGSRLVYPLERDAMRFANIVGNKFFALLFSFLLGQRLKDTLCGTKVLWREDYPKLLEAREHFGGVDRWGDYDWIFGAARHNLHIVELPIHYRNRKAGQTKMTRRLANAWRMLRMCAIALRRVRLI